MADEGIRAADDISEMAVQTALTTAWLGRPYVYLQSTGSTNGWLKEKVSGDSSTAHGTVVLTDYQTAGRGRMGRRWQAPPKTSLLFSVLLRPDWPVHMSTWLMMLAGLAVAEAVERFSRRPVALKWPNDIVVSVAERDDECAWRKLGGVLVDANMDPAGHLHSAIIGIGLNVNIPAEDMPSVETGALRATSLLALDGQPVARRPLLLALLEGLERRYGEADGGQSPWAAWNKRLMTVGRQVEVVLPGPATSLKGRAEGTDIQGHLLIRDSAGRLHTVAAGDASLRGR
jgi:BirA family biotin operon repressor/biotin-[acetyl-CoA-carboxylase] ligase